ncbi:MAG: alkaline phosphatase family protein [Planctomycetota bacterium]
MSLRSLPLLGALALGLCGGAAAGETIHYDLEGRRDASRSYKATLDVEDTEDGKVRLSWREVGVDGSEMLATGERSGPFLKVRFPAPVGLSRRLFGMSAGDVLGFYRVTGDKLSGVLIDEGGLDWRIAVERGERSAAPGFEPAGKQAWKRLVLCVDGIPYPVLRDLLAKGRFKGFRQPARMVTVFPSLSAMAWGRVLGLPPEVGYQVEYYSNHLGQVMGATKQQMLTQTMRAETRVHYRHHGIVGHALAYLFPFKVGRKQVRELIKEVRHHQGSRSAFVYAYQTDAIAHMDGRENLEAVLGDIDEELSALQAWYRKERGEELEVVLLSDHGHTLVSGELVPIQEHLEQSGWALVEQVRGPKQVNFSSAGILSSIALHCQDSQEPELAKLVAAMKGVELCTYDLGGRQQFVVSKQGVARFDWEPQGDRYGYTVVEGQDPLGYQAVWARLAREGKLDRARRAASRDIFTATADHAYPDAPHRIRLGHKPGALVQNPANVLVSLGTGFENARGIVKKMASISPSGRNGTHGALAQPDSVGVFTTNFLPERAAVRPEDVTGLIDTRDLHQNRPSLEVVADPSAAPDPDAPAAGPGVLWVEVKAPQASIGAEEQTSIELIVRRKRFLLSDPVVWRGRFSAAELQLSQSAFRVPARVLGELKAGTKYRIQTVIERSDGLGKVVERREDEVEVDYRGTHQVFD